MEKCDCGRLAEHCDEWDCLYRRNGVIRTRREGRVFIDVPLTELTFRSNAAIIACELMQEGVADPATVDWVEAECLRILGAS